MPKTPRGTAPASLGDLEAAVLRLLLRLGPSTAESVRSRLDRPLKESTVRTVLKRLEEKGYATHDVLGRTFIYRPARPAAELVAHGIRKLAGLLYQGSVADLLVGLVDSSQLKPDELDRLAKLVARARREPR
jgi:BlaI family transcriptional regulator, penicillinase repressor